MTKRTPKSKPLVSLLLDSGAFSAWNRDEEINIKEYISYVKRNAHLLHSYVNLDVIPGIHGQRRLTDDVEKSARLSYDNLQTMKADGLRPIPVFHHGESLSWLEKLLKDGETYIGLSASKDAMVRDHIKWLDRIWTMLTDSSGRPIVKTHGFGITNPKLLFRYPWHTVDSTTWSITPGYGQIIIPIYENGKPNYGRPPVRVIVSGQAQKSSVMQFQTLGPTTRACVEQFLEQVGITVAEARYSTEARRKAVLLYYVWLTQYLDANPVTFMHRKEKCTHKFKPADVKFTLMYATAMKNRDWSHLMNNEGAHTRLISYYEIKNDPDEALHEYVTKGIIGTRSRRMPPRKWYNEGYLNYRRLRLAGRSPQVSDNAEAS